MAYLLDTNVFLEARKTHYGMDFCPAFWRWLTASHADGEVFLGPIHGPYEGANLAKISKDEPPRSAAADVQEALLRSMSTGTD